MHLMVLLLVVVVLNCSEYGCNELEMLRNKSVVVGGGELEML